MTRARWLSLIAVAGLVAACAPVAAPPAVEPITPTPEIFNPVPPEMRAEVAAREALAQMLGVDMAEIDVRATEPTEWPDTCLGLTNVGHNCASSPTPGYRILLDAGEATYEVRTDAEAKTVLIAGQV